MIEDGNKVKQIELNGLTFQYRESGEPSAPPIVALHALGKSAESWDQVAAVFLMVSFQVFRM